MARGAASRAEAGRGVCLGGRDPGPRMPVSCLPPYPPRPPDWEEDGADDISQRRDALRLQGFAPGALRAKFSSEGAGGGGPLGRSGMPIVECWTVGCFGR